MPEKCRLASTVEKIKVSINLFQNIFSIDLLPNLLIWYEEQYNQHENQTNHFDKSWQQWQSLWTTPHAYEVLKFCLMYWYKEAFKPSCQKWQENFGGGRMGERNLGLARKCLTEII